jgi:hypothetical protein
MAERKGNNFIVATEMGVIRSKNAGIYTHWEKGKNIYIKGSSVGPNGTERARQGSKSEIMHAQGTSKVT